MERRRGQARAGKGGREMSHFTLSREVPLGFEPALAAFKEALAGQGFGIMYELDFSGIIAAKTGEPLPGRVTGLGVCDPRLARQALLAEPQVAAILPCGVFACETATGTLLGALDPDRALALADTPALEPLGTAARVRLQAALDAVAAAPA